ncbi:lytic transglycosylase domain-containing protein [Temperatibacter marinus]|uniref:Lytic transglycosylase domain-containing protein n=1 Tax=Temperatibacter marinus TaxID=1456591 RepID=A0AA52H8M6_9PROT|nr:lytic transglycosylase domain-containing protein [Temperatibacter marinus]WND02004.1 lytic transglycosylase domain-containing protein [Temperatibacter marinus]
MAIFSSAARSLTNMFVVFSFVAVLSPVSYSADKSKDVSTLPGESLNNVPGILSKSDEKLYRQIFDYQKKGDWRRAERLIKRVENTILLGHVRYQKLMHPKKYRSKYHELAAWMARYADHPYAYSVYRLAMKRRGRANAPRRPVETKYPGVTGQSARQSPAVPYRNRALRSSVYRFKKRIRTHVRRGEPERAERRYWAMEATKVLTDHEKAQVLARIASSYYYDGKDEKARAISLYGSALSSQTEALNDWIAGLSAYRQGLTDKAHHSFKKLTFSDDANSWLTSAGHFWASRTAYQDNNAALGEKHLRLASGYKETFYGMIAGYQLGIEPSFDWSLPELTAAEMFSLNAYPAVRRAIALVEVGRDDLADEELRLLWGREGVTVQKQLMALASRLNLPAIQIRLGYAGGLDKRAPVSVKYPLPDWKPADGMRVDRALIFAMMRKESGFRSRARSHVGARGLMQVMPATARVLYSRNRTLRKNRDKLTEPEYNMALGQQYVEYLNKMEYTEANLLMLLAAYNGGPGNLLKWRKDTRYDQDPLLFIESISFYETRDYIERVMANLWLYRNRLGQATPTLEALAQGAWPALIQLDTPQSRKSKNRRLARR